MRQRTLLLIDDDRIWLNITARFFRELSYIVLKASACAEGIEMARQCRPDCILLDFHMPDLDGGAAASQIRADAELRKTPVIMVSGDAQKEFESQQEYKVDGFFLKGGSPQRLRAMIDSLLRRVELERGIVQAGDLYIDGSNLRVFRDSKLVTKLSQDQFRLLSILVEKSPDFVNEDDISRHIFGVNGGINKPDAIRGLAYRLRGSLGTQLGHRIISQKGSGWGYVQPRERGKEAS